MSVVPSIDLIDISSESGVVVPPDTGCPLVFLALRIASPSLLAAAKNSLITALS